MSTALTRRALMLGTSALAAVGAATPVPAAGPPGPTAAGAAPGGAPGGPPLRRLLANENPYGPGEAARKAIAAMVPDAWQYPVFQVQPLRKMIAEREGLTPEHVLVTDGSGEALRIAALTYGLGRGEIIAAHPTFDFLQSYARTLGATVKDVPLDAAMRHDLPAMASAIGPRTALMYVCNPNNPTGTLVPGPELRPFVAEVSRRVPVLVDEAYLDLWDDLPAHTAVTRVAAGDNVIVTRTFSKLHGLAGLRIGYALARPDIIKALEPFRMSLLNLAGIAAATASYQDLEFQAWSRRQIHAGLDLTQATLAELGRPHVPDTRGNFVFFDTGGPGAQFSAAMRREGILVGRPFAPYDNWCRVSMGRMEDLEAFCAALRRYYGSPAGGSIAPPS